MSTQHTPTPYYLNGNAQMHGTRWVADGTTGKPLSDVEVLQRCNSHDALVSALRDAAKALDDAALTFAGTAAVREHYFAKAKAVRAALAAAEGK